MLRQLSFSKANVTNHNVANNLNSSNTTRLLNQLSSRENPNLQLNLGNLSQRSNDGGSAPYTNRSDKTNDTDETSVPDIAADGLYGYVKKTANAFVRNFIDYGPPYNDLPFDPILVNECSKPILNHIEVNRLLNTRIDPNGADPDDLYYTAMHWCARNMHLFGMKMLRRAGARFDVTNELGQTPLDMIVIMKYPPDKRNLQLKVIKYMLKNGAPVNTRDKAGYGPIDLAAANQDLDVIILLLDHGANVMRKNHIFVAPREHILKYVTDPMCYKVLNEKLKEEQEQIDEINAKKKVIQDDKALDTYYEDLHASLDKKKLRRLEREKKYAELKRKEVTDEYRKKKLAEEMEQNLKKREEIKSSQGIWKKVDEYSDHWELKDRVFVPRLSNKELYRDSKQLMHDLKQSSSITTYEQQWKQLTGGGKLETKWKHTENFVIPELVDEDDEISFINSQFERKKLKQTGRSGLVRTSSRQSRTSVNSRGSLKSGMNSRGSQNGTIFDVDYRDENDLALEGEDLSGLLEDLT